jgi:Cu(I)/Ag(I) efflux system membrane fusion protein
MKKWIETVRNNYRWALIVLGIGILLGWLIFRTPSDHGDETALQASGQGYVAHDHENGEATVWTCSMHPQIRQDGPGKCPICGMDLIPLASLKSGGDEGHPDEISMTESAAELANIQTIRVTSGTPDKKIFLQGKVQADERRISELTARFGGRIEKLYVSFTGENVKQGQKLATIYSPALVTAQRELLEAMSFKEERPSLYRAARAKLRLWDLTEEQINQIENDGEPQLYFDILSPTQGTVTRRDVALGDYVKEGSALFQVIDLTHVWIMLDVYESDLPWIEVGDPVAYTLPSVPGRVFRGKVIYIDPFIDPRTRVIKVRAEQNNRDLLLKPEMFVNATVESKTAAGSNQILIPRSSVLWTGKRSVVYVKVPDRNQPSILYREITLGPESGNFYLVEDGLSVGEEIAVNGVFKIDAAAQLAGKSSMMNPPGAAVPANHDPGTGHPPANDDQMANVPGKKVSTFQVSGKFKEQLQTVFDDYTGMIDAFIASDPESVRKKAGKFRSGLDAVDMELLEGKSHMVWMAQLKALKAASEKIAGTDDLGQQRIALADFSNALHEVLETFRLPSGTVYYQYCPMASGDEGAYWLSTIKEIRNPYFGDMMLSCGETREILDFSSSSDKK